MYLNYLNVKFNPRLTKGGGGGCNPPYGFSRSLQNAKESVLGHIGNLFYILYDHFDEKQIRVPPYPKVG